ncbi:MAG: ArsR family transcriptional regulator [Chloroflexota bacterium]|nr:ArsR family transcriptional regulator [Chloroflexota bacterium]
MQETRQQILEFLRRHDEATVQALSAELGLTSVTIRHHLEILRAEGYITDPQVQHYKRPGRPCYVYGLAARAADLFPNNYCGLAGALLVALKGLEPAQRETVLQAVGRNLASEKAELPEDLAGRLAYIGTYLNQLGFISHWVTADDGSQQLHICNCPYQQVAACHPELCQVDAALLRELSGANLERLSVEADDAALCVYQFTWPGEPFLK